MPELTINETNTQISSQQLASLKEQSNSRNIQTFPLASHITTSSGGDEISSIKPSKKKIPYALIQDMQKTKEDIKFIKMMQLREK